MFRLKTYFFVVGDLLEKLSSNVEFLWQTIWLQVSWDEKPHWESKNKTYGWFNNLSELNSQQSNFKP